MFPARPTVLRAALPACLLLVLTACSDTPAPPAAAAMPPSVPEAVATPTEASPRDAIPMDVGLDGSAVRAFLVSQYGELAQLQGDWPGAPLVADLGTATASREVCARGAIGTQDAPAELVAVCGVPDGAGHVTAALTDFFLLRADGDTVIAEARAHIQRFGSIGDVADVQVRRFGPHTHGFVVEDGFTGQGITVGSTVIVLPEGKGFDVAASLRSSLDNLGAMDACAELGNCSDDEAYDLAFELSVDTRAAESGVWPLLVHERGEACGRRVDRTHTVPFNAARRAWAVPASLQREGGCD